MMRILIILSLLCVLTACSSGQSTQLKYYDFTHQKTSDSASVTELKQAFIHVNQVKIEGVADQQPLIQLLNDHSVNIANYHFWSQHPKHTLTNALTRALAKDISDFSTVPAGKTKIDIDDIIVEVTVTKLVGHYSLGSLIEGQWFIYNNDINGKRLQSSELFSISTPLQNSGFDALIKAHQTSWEKLTGKVTKAILTKTD